MSDNQADLSHTDCCRAHSLELLRPQRNERLLIMNHENGWMNGWMGGGRWGWTVIGVLIVVLLIVVISKLSKK